MMGEEDEAGEEVIPPKLAERIEKALAEYEKAKAKK